ncbi:pfkB family carbohydrate kinase [Carpediemonas membranifera]|uniref:Adenosine kinase n=1 Tax=Carpediemonas membranifera TaxID=201153 RepID=A0A8J6AU00_9EUKA|nr:pfkB family carbohydrate kinase [Carpediemonas membranifera]|eukprot:KAG9394591.1 pfkB family carbohydrate kinase [Carpediemonas membranifera]
MSATTKCLLFCAGNPLMDEIYTKEVNGEFLKKSGLEPARAVIWPSAKLSDLMATCDASFEATPGGSVLNTARIFQAILAYNAKRSITTGDQFCVFYAGSVANDATGNRMREMLTEHKIEHRFCVTEDDSTGHCAVFIDDNRDRSLVASLGASTYFDPCLFDQPDVLRFLDEVPAVYFSGFFITDNYKSTQKLIELAQQRGKSICFNLASPFVVNAFTDRLLAVVEACDVLLGNEAEYGSLAEVIDFPKEADGKVDLSKLAVFLSTWKRGDRALRNVVVTQGPHDTIVVDKETDGKPVTFPVEAVPREQLIDTNGAGDAFAGGYTFGRIMGYSMQRSVHVAHLMAKMVIKRSGVQTEISDDDMQ